MIVVTVPLGLTPSPPTAVRMPVGGVCRCIFDGPPCAAEVFHPDPTLTCVGAGALRRAGSQPHTNAHMWVLQPQGGLTDEEWRDNLSPEPLIPTALAEMASGLGGFSVRAFCPLLVSPRG